MTNFDPARIRTVFFDLGGPLLKDGEEDGYDLVPLAVLEEQGCRTTAEAIAEAKRQAVESYAPRFPGAVIWQLTRPDQALFQRCLEACEALWHSFPPPAAREEAEEVCRQLGSRYTLRLASQCSLEEEERALHRANLRPYFWLSPKPRHPKPDRRFYEGLLRETNHSAAECVMIGDRLASDILPAKEIGMATVWFPLGLFRHQLPRTPDELPEAEIERLEELLAVFGLE